MTLKVTRGRLKWCHLHFLLIIHSSNDVLLNLAAFLRYYHLFMK